MAYITGVYNSPKNSTYTKKDKFKAIDILRLQSTKFQSSDFLYRWWFPEAALQRCSYKVFWKYAANLQENTHAWNHTSPWALSCKFAAYFQKTFSWEHLWRAASVFQLQSRNWTRFYDWKWKWPSLLTRRIRIRQQALSVNEYGRHIKDLCVASKLGTLNGRKRGDFQGRLIYLGYHACSTADLLLSSKAT